MSLTTIRLAFIRSEIETCRIAATVANKKSYHVLSLIKQQVQRRHKTSTRSHDSPLTPPHTDPHLIWFEWVFLLLYTVTYLCFGVVFFYFCCRLVSAVCSAICFDMHIRSISLSEVPQCVRTACEHINDTILLFWMKPSRAQSRSRYAKRSKLN